MTKRTELYKKNVVSYKWIVANVIVLIWALSFSSCSKTKKKDITSVGKYVYIDSQHILHINKNCVLGMEITDAAGNSYYKAINFIDTVQLTKEHIKSMCMWCVEDEHYSQLKRIADEHEEFIDYMPGVIKEGGLGWGNGKIDW